MRVGDGRGSFVRNCQRMAADLDLTVALEYAQRMDVRSRSLTAVAELANLRHGRFMRNTA
jgi:hypothetical protein